MEHQRKSRAPKILKLFGTLTVVLVASVLAYSTLVKHARAAETTNLPPVDAVTLHRSHLPTKATSVDISQLSDTINNVINQNSGIDMSVSLIDLGNNQASNFGDSSSFEAASVGKVLTAADFLHQVETGNESLSETINYNTAKDEIQQMIVNSDDGAWGALNDEVGFPNLANYAASIGLNYDSTNNLLTTADTATLLAKLWDNQLLNDSDTQLLLTYMEQANYRDYIVPAVPSSDFVYHKVGLYNDEVNDAAIISNGKQALVLVIFTNGNGVYNWPARAQMMQTISIAAIKTYL